MNDQFQSKDTSDVPTCEPTELPKNEVEPKRTNPFASPESLLTEPETKTMEAAEFSTLRPTAESAVSQNETPRIPSPPVTAYAPRPTPANPPMPPYAPNPTAAPPLMPPYAPRPTAAPSSMPPYAPRPTAAPSSMPPYAPRPTAEKPTAAPTSEMPSGPRPTARPTAKKAKSKGMGWRIALIALCCSLLGSALGGGLVGYYMSQKDDTPAKQTEQKEPQSGQLQEPSVQTPQNDQPQSSSQQQTTNPGNTSSLAQIYDNCVPSIVGVTNQYTTYDYFGQPSTSGATGTGFIISEDGEILTNYHVVENAEKLTITMHNGKEYPAELLGYEAESDVALLKIDVEGLQAVKLGDSDALAVGDQVAAIGNPLGELTYTMTVGYVSAKSRAVYTDEMPITMMQIDAAINSGNSGGPLFNLAGEVVGITTAKYSGSINGSAEIEGIGFAIPINDALSIVDDLRQYGSVKNRAYIGVTVTNSQAGGDIPAGALVQSIEKNSSGEKAGLRVSDIITAVGSSTVTDIDTLYSALRPYRAGDTVEITVFRSGETKTLTITFDATPGSETTDETPEDFDFPWG